MLKFLNKLPNYRKSNVKTKTKPTTDFKKYPFMFISFEIQETTI